MSDPIDALLPRLDGVRSTGHGKWIARCPAHADKRPSLSIRCSDDGALLIHCFVGCAAADIIAALGLELADLFPPRLPDLRSARPRVSTLTPLVVTFERDLVILYLLLEDLEKGKPIGAADRITAKSAAARVWSALQEARRVF